MNEMNQDELDTTIIQSNHERVWNLILNIWSKFVA